MSRHGDRAMHQSATQVVGAFRERMQSNDFRWAVERLATEFVLDWS